MPVGVRNYVQVRDGIAARQEFPLENTPKKSGTASDQNLTHGSKHATGWGDSWLSE
jgi:hypothetical protein